MKNNFIRVILAVLIFTLCLALFSCTEDRITKIKLGKETIRIGTKNFTEQKIWGYVLKNLIEENTDYIAEVVSFGGTGLVFNALKNGDIDMYCEYTGTMYSALLLGTKPKDRIFKPKEIYELTKTGMNDNFDILVLDPIGFENNYALCVSEKTMKKYNLETITNLIPYAEKMKHTGSFEWMEREDGLIALKNTYGINFLESFPIESGLMYDALLYENVDCVAAFSTDGEILKYNLKLLKDDGNALLSYYLCPIISESFAIALPEVKEAINMLSGKITSEMMQEFNLMFEENDLHYNDVAVAILRKNGIMN